MADTKIEIGLSPDEVIAALKKISDEAKNLQNTIEDSLGKKASSSINDLKDNAERGTNQITKFFSNMGTRIKEDLKTAFAASSVMAGAGFAKQIGDGVKQVFDMERAFDRLNVRMGLSVKAMNDFKTAAGRASSEAGVNIKDITPGLMEAAGRGGVSDPKQMTMIAKSLAQSRQIDPSLDTGSMVDQVAEILQRQGQRMTGLNFGQTSDAINAAAANGGFKNAGDAANHIAALSQYSTTNGMDTRSLAGLATVASKGGPATQALLNQILEAGGQPGGQDRVNGVLGQQVFKNGQLDPSALGKVDTKQFGAESILGVATGLGGANGGDLKMLVNSFRDNMDSFEKVAGGVNETSTQFDKATESWAAKVELFKSRLTEAGQEIGDGIAEWADGVMSGDASKKAGGIGKVASAAWDHAGDLATGGAIGIGASLLMGGGIRGLIGSSAASAAGVQKVYVTNASEFSGGSSVASAAEAGMLSTAGKFIRNKAAGAMMLGMSGLGEIAGMGAGAIGLAGAGVAAAGAGGYGLGLGINYLTGNKGQGGDALYDYLNPDTNNNQQSTSPEQLANILKIGMVAAMREHDGTRPKQAINPTAVAPRGPVQ